MILLRKKISFSKVLTLLLALICLFCVFSVSCNAQVIEELEGKWAYIYEKDKCSLSFKNGTMKLDGEKYKYSVKDDTLLLTKDDKTDSMKFLLSETGNELSIYKKTEYVFEGVEEPDSIIGKWVNKDNKWSFEFKENGEFNEDGFFPGFYSINNEDSSFKLMYMDHFEDIVCYFVIDGNTLTVEYPWQMIKMQ